MKKLVLCMLLFLSACGPVPTSENTLPISSYQIRLTNGETIAVQAGWCGVDYEAGTWGNESTPVLRIRCSKSKEYYWRGDIFDGLAFSIERLQ